jgi:hypothetical protein
MNTHTMITPFTSLLKVFSDKFPQKKPKAKLLFKSGHNFKESI